MPTDLPLLNVVNQILQQTPPRVWVILLIITALGLLQVRDHAVTARRLILVALALGAYSLTSAVSVFGLRIEVLAAWVVGMALSVGVISLGSPQGSGAQQLGAGRYAVQGSLSPLITMWTVFAVRYATTVALVLHPEWARDPAFSLAMPMVYGALSGFFLARALRILRSAPQAATLSLA